MATSSVPGKTLEPDQGSDLTAPEAVHQIAQQLLLRQGEVITPTLALERARNIVAALNGLTIGGRS